MSPPPQVLRPAPGPLPHSLANAVKPLLGEAATFRRLSADTLFFCFYFQQARTVKAARPFVHPDVSV
jgi:CCR4-NOT transcriptional regulation complex NOT5 subunit